MVGPHRGEVAQERLSEAAMHHETQALVRRIEKLHVAARRAGNPA
jgi:hypothetical protein